MGQIDDIASNIYVTEFIDDAVNSGCGNTPTATCNPSYIPQKKLEIAAWLETNIGQLNILINADFRVDAANNVCPVLKDEEIAIFIQLYLKAYYKRQSRQALTSASSSSSSTTTTGDPVLLTSDWTELREGDSVIKRTAQVASPQQRVQIANAYRSFSDEADIKMVELVHAYNMYRSSPRQVAGSDAPESEDCCTESACTPTSTGTPASGSQGMTFSAQ